MFPNREDVWPALPLDAWKDTYATLHLWLQIIGKVKLKLAPRVNHWWQVALHVTPRGMTTLMIPYGDRAFEIRIDFIDHALIIETDEGERREMALAPMAVSEFHSSFLEILASLGLPVTIDPMPKEIPNAIRFDDDQVHRSYDREFAHRFWKANLESDRVLQIYRARFIGKSSPVHFFWGSCDLAVTRFSGRRAPPRPGVDVITREAYSHEVMSVGFWPGGGNVLEPAYYAYAAPEPPGYKEAKLRADGAYYNPVTKGFVLSYDRVRLSPDPDFTLLEFAQSAYEAAAELGKWDRASLEKHPPAPVDKVRSVG